MCACARVFVCVYSGVSLRRARYYTYYFCRRLLFDHFCSSVRVWMCCSTASFFFFPHCMVHVCVLRCSIEVTGNFTVNSRSWSQCACCEILSCPPLEKSKITNNPSQSIQPNYTPPTHPIYVYFLLSYLFRPPASSPCLYMDFFTSSARIGESSRHECAFVRKSLS